MSENLPAETKPRARRMWGIANGSLLLAMLGFGMAYYFTPVQAWLADGRFIRAWLVPFGSAAPWVFVAAAAGFTAIGIPRLLMYSLGGMAFGFAWGLAWSQIGTLLGSYLIFRFIRWRGRAYALHRFPRLRSFTQRLESRGLLSVLLLRQMPLSGFYNTLLLGLTPVTQRDFLCGSFLGFLPLGTAACLLGAGLIQQDVFKGLNYMILGLACAVILGFFCKRLVLSFSTPRDDETH